MSFIQLVEVVTSRREEIEDMVNEYIEQTEGRRKARRGTLAEDRDRPGTFVQVVEFDSYEDAMANSNLPETTAFAERLAKLCDRPPTYRNLDVIRVEDM
jgi:quinol monooxygenase YgiN